MRPSRPVLSSLAGVVLLLLSAHASTARRFFQVERGPSGRDSVRVLGDGEAARFIQIGDRLEQAAAVGSDEPQRYLVTFDEPAGPAAFANRVSERQALARRFGNELGNRGAGRSDASGQALPRVLVTYDRLIAGAAVLAAPNSEAMLRAIPGVRAVFPDRKVTADAAENITQVRADRVQQELGGSGLGVRVGIVDTGIDYTHAALGGGFGPGFRVAGGWDFVNHDADPRDDHGHGTHVAGIVAGNGGGIVGMAPAASLYAYKVLDLNGSGWLSDVILGLERCADPDQDPNTDDALDAVNLSLGSFPVSDADPATDAVDALDSLGTIVVVAAGNFGIDFAVSSPGTARGAITVGSVAGNDTLSWFSSRGPTIGLRIKPDLLAPGESIASAWLNGQTAVLSGTSMATPHVTGAAALLRQLHPDWAHEEMRSALVSTAKDLGRPAAQQGSGRLDAWAAATATLFVSPTSLSFGRVSTGEPDWVRAETLHVHSRAPGVTDVTLSLELAKLPPWLEATLSTDHLLLDAGVPGEAILRLRAAAHAPMADYPYLVEGAVRLRSGGQDCRVPFSIHEALKLELTAENGTPTGVLIGRGRAWPSLAFGATWLLQPGLYDVLTFTNYQYARQPFLGMTDVSITSDSVLAVERSTATSDVTFSLRDEHGAPNMPKTMGLRLLFEDGGGLGFMGLRDPSVYTVPVMKPGYRLEWWALDDEGSKRYDIPGVEYAPFTSHVVDNDPSALRRLVEHVRVPAPDSLLLLEFPLFSDGDGWFGFAGLDPFSTPFGNSFDVVRWTAPVPTPGHLRFGHSTWSLDPRKARAFAPDAINGMSPVWDQRHGDTLLVARRFSLGEPLARFTGRDLPFGSGTAFPDAWFQLDQDIVEILPQTLRPQLFRDGAGSLPAGAPSSYEIRSGSTVLESGTVDTEDLLGLGRWQKPRPGRSPFDLILRSNGWSVAGRPSTTTVTVRFDALGACPSPEWFSIVAGGGPAERIAFGQHRDPHVELRFGYITDDTPIAIEVRAKDQTNWTPLVVERHGTSIRAAIPPVYGEVAMRVSIGAVPSYYTPMTVEMEPAFVGAPSAAANAQVVQAYADANGARVEWRVNLPNDVLMVERFEPDAGWRPRAEVVVDADGIARFTDAAVTPGRRYGYRLGGSDAAVFVEIPTALTGLALAIRPNPSSEGLLASVTLDRAAPVTIRVHDVQGRLVASRTWTGLGPGLHVLPVLARGKAKAGLYFVRLECQGATRDRRATLLE